MIEVHALTAVFTVEILIALATVLILMVIRAMGKKRAERLHAGLLVERINDGEKARMKELEEVFPANGGGIDPAIRQQTLASVGVKEKVLYREVIQAFLNRDAEKLAQLDTHVGDLAKPYGTLVKQLMETFSGQESKAHSAEKAALEGELRQAQMELQLANEQLKETLATLSEVSGEYAKMFGTGHHADELHASRERMLAAFHRGEQLANRWAATKES
jgi:hypothetical protein